MFRTVFQLACLQPIRHNQAQTLCQAGILVGVGLLSGNTQVLLEVKVQ